MKVGEEFTVKILKKGKGVGRLNRTEYCVVVEVGDIITEAAMTVWFDKSVSFEGLLAKGGV
jgi:hypothetical protein